MRIALAKYRVYWVLIAALPVIWPVGGEQFILPVVVLLLMFWRIVFSKAAYLRNASISVWVLWLISMVMSVGMVDDNLRYVTWFRNTTVACSGFAMAYLVYETHREINVIQGFLLIVLLYCTACAVTGLLGVLGVDFKYMSPLAVALQVKDVGYLHDIFVRSFVQADALWFDKRGFIRPKGLLLYANLLSGVVLVGSGIKLYWLATRKKSLIFILAMTALLLVDGIVVVATLSRSAWIGLAVAFFSVLVLARLRVGAKIGLLAILMAVMVLALVSGIDNVIEKRFVDKANSNEERMTNYRLIGAAVMQDPVHFMLGYGSQRDTWQIGIPIGSHSTYLGMLYKYGFLGLAFFTSGIALMFLRLRKAIQLDNTNRLLGAVLMSSLIQMAIQALFVEIDVDVAYMMIWWVLVGLSLAYSDHVIDRHRKKIVQRQRHGLA